MQTIKEQFVPYEIALAMKELGFDEPCIGFYYLFNEEIRSLISTISNTNSSWENEYISMPLWQQCIDWLETKGYYINITRVFQWNPSPIKFLGWCIYISTENPEEQLECNSYYVKHYYPTKQEAREQAILKCIELCKQKEQK